MASGFGLSVPGILALIYKTIIEPIIHDVIGAFSVLIGDSSTGLGNATVTMFQQWSQSLYGIGIWAPVIFVVVLGTAGGAVYFFLDGYGAEKDVLGAERDA